MFGPRGPTRKRASAREQRKRASAREQRKQASAWEQRKQASAWEQRGSPLREASFGSPTHRSISAAHFGGRRDAHQGNSRGKHHLGGAGINCGTGAHVKSHPPSLLGGRHSKTDSRTSVLGPRRLGDGGSGQALGPNRPASKPSHAARLTESGLNNTGHLLGGGPGRRKFTLG
jgi:hypothetical protein